MEIVEGILISMDLAFMSTESSESDPDTNPEKSSSSVGLKLHFLRIGNARHT